MRTIVTLNTENISDEEVQDLVQYFIIAMEWNQADICPHDIKTRDKSKDYFLTYIPSDDNLMMFNKEDVNELSENYKPIVLRDKYDWFRTAINIHY